MPEDEALTMVETAVRHRSGDLVALSHSIHSEPELAFDEHKSCAKTKTLVAERGFEITAAPGGLDTAFRAVFGAGSLVVGVCAEYDALPEIGHACGHNVIAASSVGTALALAEVAEDLDLTVVLLGTPAEEAGGGKALMLEAGAFDDIAAAFMLHPGSADMARPRSLALSQVAVTYLGREAHAAIAPQMGRNAADAATVTQVAVGLLRQHLGPGDMVHGIVTAGGQAANIIPGHAEMSYIMRANDTAALRELNERMSDCFRAGAVATGCEFQVRETEPTYLELTPDRWLSEMFAHEMRRLGRTPAAAQIEASAPFGSTDMGNVTQWMPAIHPIVGIDEPGAWLHQPAFATAAAGPGADTAVVEGAVMLARTVVGLASTAVQRDRVHDLQLARQATKVG